MGPKVFLSDDIDETEPTVPSIRYTLSAEVVLHINRFGCKSTSFTLFNSKAARTFFQHSA